MAKSLTPDICSSLSGCAPPQNHCRDCSHAYFLGEVRHNGKVYRFEFNPQYGPVFLKKNGDPLSRQPGERNKVWDKWQEWYDEKFNG